MSECGVLLKQKRSDYRYNRQLSQALQDLGDKLRLVAEAQNMHQQLAEREKVCQGLMLPYAVMKATLPYAIA